MEVGLSYLFTDEEVNVQNSYNIIQAEPAFRPSLAPGFMFSTPELHSLISRPHVWHKNRAEC